MPRVMVVDDEVLLLRLLVRGLEGAGHRVEAFERGAEALKALDGQDFDVAIVDRKIPVMGGLEILKEVRARRPNCHRVLMSGHLDSTFLVRAVNEGGVARVVEKAGWAMDEVDLFEINEAFASVTMAAMADNGLDHQKVNINGGACALGHPIGASGARILVTLIHALRRRELQRGVASLCLGGGEAVAVAIEVPQD